MHDHGSQKLFHLVGLKSMTTKFYDDVILGSHPFILPRLRVVYEHSVTRLAQCQMELNSEGMANDIEVTEFRRRLGMVPTS